MKNKSAYHWLTAVFASLVMCGSIGLLINCAGLFYTPVAEELGIGQGSIALYSTITSLVGGFFSPVVTTMIKKMNMNLMMAIGICLQCGGYACLGLAHSIVIFYVMAPIMGIGYCMCTSIPLLIIANNWFEKFNGLVVGIIMSSSGIGGAIFTQILNSLIASVGWRTSYFIGAAAALAMSLPGIILFIRPNPEDRGLLPYGAAAPRVRSESSAKGKNVKSSVVSIPLIMLCAAGIFGSCVPAMNQHFKGYGTEIGAGAAAGALMMTGCMIGNIISKLLFGILSDFIGPVPTCIGFTTIASVTLALLTFGSVTNSTVLFVFGVLFGFSFAFCAVALPLIIRKVFGLEKYAQVFSVVNICTNTGFALFLTIIGSIYDMTGTYRIATGACLVCAVTSAVFVILTVISAKKNPQQ